MRSSAKKAGRENVNKIFKNTSKAWNTWEIGVLLLYFQNLFVRLIRKQMTASWFKYFSFDVWFVFTFKDIKKFK